MTQLASLRLAWSGFPADEQIGDLPPQPEFDLPTVEQPQGHAGAQCRVADDVVQQHGFDCRAVGWIAA